MEKIQVYVLENAAGSTSAVPLILDVDGYIKQSS